MIVLGLLYFAIGLLVLLVPFLLTAGAADAITVSSLAFAAILLVAAPLSLKGKRWSFALAAVVSLLFLLLFGSFLGPILANPADPTFWFAISAIPVLVLAFVFSVLALRNAKPGVGTKPYLASPRSTGGLLTVAVLGFVVGGLVVGNIAATTIARILEGTQEPSDIRIVPNAAGVDLPFDPATFDVSVGATVVWFNGDTATHTVTSNATGLFESGNFLPGATFRHAFNTAGTYAYHCTPHPLMTGTIVVA